MDNTLKVVVGYDKLDFFRRHKEIDPSCICISNYYQDVSWIEFYDTGKEQGGLWNHVNTRKMFKYGIDKYKPWIVIHNDCFFKDYSILVPNKINLLERSFSPGWPYSYVLTIPDGYHDKISEIMATAKEGDHIEMDIHRIHDMYYDNMNLLRHPHANGYIVYFKNLEFIHTHDINGVYEVVGGPDASNKL